MWQFLSAVFCIHLAVCNVNASTLTTTWQVSTPTVAPAQERPQPPGEVGRRSRATPAQEKSKQKGGVRIEGSKIEMGPQEQEEEINLLSGPARVELIAVNESRIRFEGEPPDNAPESSLRLQVKVLGKRLDEVVGLGKVVVEELIDDTGAVLVTPADVDPRDRTEISQTRISQQVRQIGFISRSADTKAPSRAARKLTKVSGWINLMYATETEEIMIDNPLQYSGGYLEHPRLKELGIKLRLIEPGDEVNLERDGHGLALVHEENGKKLRKVDYYDAWLKPMYPRPRQLKTADGQDYVYYGTAMGRVNEDMQLVLVVYPEIDEEQVRFTFENVALP